MWADASTKETALSRQTLSHQTIIDDRCSEGCLALSAWPNGLRPVFCLTQRRADSEGNWREGMRGEETRVQFAECAQGVATEARRYGEWTAREETQTAASFIPARAGARREEAVLSPSLCA